MTNKSGDVFIPGSKIPFKPINPWGREAVITDHKGDKIDWKNPLEDANYQLFVDDAQKGTIPVCPAASHSIVSEWLGLINLSIKTGKITGWSNVNMVKQPRQRAVARVF